MHYQTGMPRLTRLLQLSPDREASGLAFVNERIYVSYRGRSSIEVYRGVAPFNRLPDITGYDIHISYYRSGHLAACSDTFQLFLGSGYAALPLLSF